MRLSRAPMGEWEDNIKWTFELQTRREIFRLPDRLLLLKDSTVIEDPYYLCGSTAPVDLGRFFSFLIYIQAVGHLDGGSGRRIAATYTQNNTKHRKKRTQTSMPLVGFEPTIPVFKRAKTVHSSHRTATVIGESVIYSRQITNKTLLKKGINSPHTENLL
jgi:hypothetical protein